MRLAFWRADGDWTAAKEPTVETVASEPALAADPGHYRTLPRPARYRASRRYPVE